MNPVKRAAMQAKLFLEQMSRERQFLLVAMLIIMVLAALVILPYAGKPDVRPLPPVSEAAQGDLVQRLEAAGINVTAKGSQLLVPATQHAEAYAVMVHNDLMAPDITGPIKDMIERQSPWMSDRQNEQAERIATQQVLGRVIGLMPDVQSATVMIATPRGEPFGRLHVGPTASVAITTKGGHRLTKRQAESIARFVSGSVAKMKTEAVQVIANGHAIRVDGPDEDEPGRGFEILKQREDYYLAKVHDLLSYIPGAIVALSVETDSVVRKDASTYTYTEDPPVSRTEDIEETRTTTERAAEPGVRANTGNRIDRGGNQQNEERIEGRREYIAPMLVSAERTREMGMKTTRVNVTINVPRSYFITVQRESAPQPDPVATVADQAPAPVNVDPAMVADELKRIEDDVMNLVSAGTQAEVRAQMIPDPRILMDGWNGETQQAGGLLGLVTGEYAKPVTVATLSLLSMAMMFGMVRRATKQPQLPSLEELAGVPPTLPTEDEIIGEAMATDASLAGYEVEQEDLETRKIAEQISEMIMSSPEEATQLFHRWIKRDDY